MEELYIVKIGGAILENEDRLRKFAKNVANIKGKKIVVHGGGRTASNLSQQLGIKPNLVDGRRITDKNTLDVVTMVYAGLLNKKLVAHLQKEGCNSVGLSGADLNSILAFRREVKTIDYGYVGDIEVVNHDAIKLLIDNDVVPTFCAITHDGEGQLLNTNADTIASMLSESLCKSYSVHLLYCFEKSGVLRDSEDDDSLITKLSHSDFSAMKMDGSIHLGMIPKLDNAFYALLNGAKSVKIGHVDALQDIDDFKGTEIC